MTVRTYDTEEEIGFEIAPEIIQEKAKLEKELEKLRIKIEDLRLEALNARFALDNAEYEFARCRVKLDDCLDRIAMLEDEEKDLREDLE